ncbi:MULTISPECIES: response regulator [unclassified Flavobacterium]|uniref:response regulator n=1 Tax=unclassified Flavobacterium TaxID=196869 RepID=UPI001F12E7ED|nr:MULTISPECIES: response regulator [unclassified Flavobacterium]UMY64646.1 response regulator [Flavobacterium sp. HJ-32-4]
MNTDTLRILIVDDNAINLMLMKTLLKSITPQAEISEARDGEAAVSFTRIQQPDLIFMDIRMPIMDGLEATRTIRREVTGNAIRIIGLSAANTEEEKRQAVDAGMDDYLVKPVGRADIESLLAERA